MPDRDAAVELNEAGHDASERGDRAAAERAYREAIAADPEWSVPYYNLGLLCKYASRWEESAAMNARAAELSPEDEAAWWNLGIAATALGQWREARRAWRACGVTVDDGDDPPVFNWGQTPIRLDAAGAAEVVWARRLDPARARILSVPLPTAAQRWGDIVLNDGAPDGERVVDGRTYHVFNALALLEPSRFETFVVELATLPDGAIGVLETIAEEQGGAAEHWGEATRILCKDCSRGVVHDHHEGDESPAHPHCGLAALDAAQAETILSRWLELTGADVIKWYVAPRGSAA
jgi:hypothetical protein